MAGEHEGRCAIVTGGGAGIGQATALALAGLGAAVIVADIDLAAAEATAGQIAANGGKAFAIEIDVGQADEVQRMVDQAVQRFGRLDILVNNAGISGFQQKLLGDVDEAMFDRVMQVNVKGVWLGMKYAIPAMLATGGGRIVNTASTLGLIAQKYSGAYAASKHAVIGLTKTAAIEYGLQGIRVNAVCPGGIETGLVQTFKATYSEEAWADRCATQFPGVGRYGRPGEVAAAILFLCSDAASNVSGIALPVDGGYLAL